MEHDAEEIAPEQLPPTEPGVPTHDAERIARALGRINDPALAYFVSMALDRAAEITAERRTDFSPTDTMALALAAEPHGVLYNARILGGGTS